MTCEDGLSISKTGINEGVGLPALEEPRSLHFRSQGNVSVCGDAFWVSSTFEVCGRENMWTLSSLEVLLW